MVVNMICVKVAAEVRIRGHMYNIMIIKYVSHVKVQYVIFAMNMVMVMVVRNIVMNSNVYVINKTVIMLMNLKDHDSSAVCVDICFYYNFSCNGIVLGLLCRVIFGIGIVQFVLNVNTFFKFCSLLVQCIMPYIVNDRHEIMRSMNYVLTANIVHVLITS